MGVHSKFKSWIALSAVFVVGGAIFYHQSTYFKSAGGKERTPSSEADASGGGVWGFFKSMVPGSSTEVATFETALEQKNLNDQQKRGREIWFKATGNNDRFHTYVMGQKVGDRAMDFGRILLSVPHDKNTRFDDWGVMNDPDCCHPGDRGCHEQDIKKTYGFDWCPGDDELLSHVGKGESSYRDPACELDSTSGNQSACDLKFGTSTGVVGIRKFPNPRFDPEKWIKLTGGLDSWKNYMDHNKDDNENHLADGSVEPPFRIGVSCASCHASIDPVHPPINPNHPGWDNISGLIGNQYMYTAQIFGSGFAQHSIQWQMLTNARPGTVDTSAVPNDQVNNPGTMNAIINFDKRPIYEETVDTWRPVDSCGANADPKFCSCNKPDGSHESSNRCYARSTVANDKILHILKGGEDSVGPKNAILRVHFNIGVCAEQCWMNHLTDLEVLDPSQRNYGQTPFDIGQCRRDCPAYRALEDRVDDELAFVLSGRPFELYKAKGLNSPKELEAEIESRLGRPGMIEQGRQLFASEKCVDCHSSPGKNVSTNDYLAKSQVDGQRINWMGSDKRIPVTTVGTYQCRALHSNHMDGHVWSIYSSNEYKNQDTVEKISGPATGGRGYYRGISLISAWATAPFMHNNAVGPEICANHPNSTDLYLKVSGSQPCLPFNDQGAAQNNRLFEVDGRVKLFEQSMDALLDKERAAGHKQTLTTDEIDIPVTPSLPGHQGLTLVIPAGIRVSRIGSFRHKEFIADFRNFMLGRADKGFNAEMLKIFASIKASYWMSKDGKVPFEKGMLETLGAAYSNCTDDFEDKGHAFGTELQPDEKEALKAFVETL